MKNLRVVIILGLVGCATSAAWAQYGLYGSPEMVRLPQLQAPGAGQYSYPSTESAGLRAVAPASYPSLPVRGPASGVSYSPQVGGFIAQAPAGLSTPSASQTAGGAAVAGPVGPLPTAPPPPQGPAIAPPSSPAQTPGVISQMLQEAGAYSGNCSPPGAAPAAVPDAAYPPTLAPAPCTADAQPGWAGSRACVPCKPARWYASAQGLIMTRNKANKLWTTYETGNNVNQIPTQAEWDWRGGGEIRFGRWFGCGSGLCADSVDGMTCPGPLACTARTVAIEGAYWTLDSFSDFVSRSISGGSVSTPLIVDEVLFDGIPGTQYFDSARQHRVWRESELHNAEINVILGCPNPSPGMANVDFFVGARYFRFADELGFGSVDLGWWWGDEGGIHEAYLRDRITNDLVGCHFGLRARIPLGFKLGLFLNPSLGIYNNHIQNHFQLYRGDGTVAVPTQPTGTYPVDSSKDVVAFLGQIDLGVNWQFAANWEACIGYRVLFATGIGLADHQIPAYVVDIPEIADINSNADLILHGAFAGLTLRF